VLTSPTSALRLLEKGRVSVLVALDLSAAFDTVDHKVLMSVLERKYGVGGGALQWISSYLHNRQMSVHVGESSSVVKTFNYSVPQGSCLGPILFNVYSSTITDCIDSSQNLGGYADDHYIRDSFVLSTPNSESHCISRMENSIDKIMQWMSANSLKANTEKTEIVLIYI